MDRNNEFGRTKLVMWITIKTTFHWFIRKLMKINDWVIQFYVPFESFEHGKNHKISNS